MTSITDVAKYAGVAVSTVSRVLNGSGATSEKTRQKVMAAAAALNYQPNLTARALSTRKSNLLGLLVHNFKAPGTAALIAGIEQAIHDSGMELLVISCQSEEEREAKSLNTLLMRKCDAMIWQSRTYNEQLIQEFATKAPLILVPPSSSSSHINTLSFDYALGSEMLVNYLLKKGHQQIAYIAGNRGYLDAEAKLAGFQRAMDQAGIRHNPELLVWSEDSSAGGYRGIKRILQKGVRFTAIMAASDNMAAGVMHALREEDIRVPKNISVVGFGDNQAARYTMPPLTTVSCPYEEIGLLAGQAALRLINNESLEPDTLKIPVYLIERESVASLTEQVLGHW
ncbi:LacI family DNA-binding transcriptional regulator [Zooshikella ganghwensis]|uniref:LacI family DNA-binding transcriptional regulator n=1 Tax=Zooshikella ganghwensis TaxID=202772 RepID=UPI0004898A8E|nr:LacI family DNA-binding transcriptional regulator [Zooshikella ganghwensis]